MSNGRIIETKNYANKLRKGKYIYSWLINKLRHEKESNKTYQEVLIQEEKVMDEVDEEKAHEEKIEEKGKKNPVINKESILMDFIMT